jgi:5-methyltetrahydrofolate--homocysteine methyltransferase
MNDLKEIYVAVIAGDDNRITGLVNTTLQGGISAKDITVQALIPGMEEVGRQFRNGELFVPEVMLAARAMRTAMDILKPYLSDSNASMSLEENKVFVIGTVEGDIHDIGKNLVGMMMEGAGFQVIDLGVDVPVSNFITAVQQYKPNILGLSALLTTTMPKMAEVIMALEEADLRRKVIVMVGGAPVTQAYADKIGADGYAPNAGFVVEKAKQLIGYG